MHFAEDEAERLPIGAFDTLSSGRDRKTRFVWVRYRAPNLIEKWYGLPIAVAAYLVATVIFSRVDYGLVVAFFIVFAVVSVRNDNVERNHKRLWKEVFALRGGLAHALSHGGEVPRVRKGPKARARVGRRDAGEGTRGAREPQRQLLMTASNHLDPP
jgi:hypothetical protein